MTEKDIIRVLENFYIKQVKYCTNNVYIFKYNWESDFFILRENGYCVEFEIKISKQDFKNDFKKEQKHEILKSGRFRNKRRKFLRYENRKAVYENIEEIKEYKFRPNKFFYVVPEGLIPLEDIPEYAGLIYVDKFNLRSVKEAPFLHKEKLGHKLIQILCDKFYWKSKKVI